MLWHTNKHVSFTGLISYIYRSLLTYVALYMPWFCDVMHVCVWHDSCTYVTQFPRCCENRVRRFEKRVRLSSQIDAPCSHNNAGIASHMCMSHVTHTRCIYLRRECVCESIYVSLLRVVSFVCNQLVTYKWSSSHCTHDIACMCDIIVCGVTCM